MSRKVLHVAVREFIATVTTKGFIFGVLMTPVLVGLTLLILPFLINEKPPKIDGEFVVIDPTGAVLSGVRDYLAPEAVAERRDLAAQTIRDQIPEELEPIATENPGDMDQVLGSVPEFTIIDLSEADPEEEKLTLLATDEGESSRLALAVIHPDAIVTGDSVEFGAYDLYIREKLDDRIVDELQDALRSSIRAARVRAMGLDPKEIAQLQFIPRVKARAVTAEGERENTEILNLLLPAAFMMLLFISTFTGGQYLMTTVIEEKSNRVVEVLLSAVSPLELMTGKILGQLAVGLLLLGLYAGMGGAGLVAFSMVGLIDPMLIVYLVIFFFIAYFFIGALMAAIGAAVNDIREAQTLLTPVMVITMVPWLLWAPISRNPNSLFATITSLLPPINPYVMLLRLTSSTPPPFWQVLLSILIGVLSVIVAVWIAAKIFRIGILLHGKPPSFGTLLRWIRMA